MEALIILLAVALVAVIGALVVLLRRRPAPALDPQTLRRLVSEAVRDTRAQGTDQDSTPGAAAPTAVPVAAVPPGPTGPPAAGGPPDRIGPATDPAERESVSPDNAAVLAAAVEAAEQERRRSSEEAERIRAEARAEAARTLDAARAEAAHLREHLDSERRRIRQEAVEGLQAERRDLEQTQRRLHAATDSLAEQQQTLAADLERAGTERRELNGVRSDLDLRVKALAREHQDLQDQWAALEHRARELEDRTSEHEAELARIAGLTADAARAELLARQEQIVRREVALMTRRVEHEAEATAKQRARAIVADAIQRVATDQTAQTVVSVLHLPSDDVKGRIIGREGRNIRAFETVTGVNVIIDDTPEAVLLSCFDPVRREIGRITLQMLIDDGRIHPHRIEEAHERAKDEVDVLCQRAAEDALLSVDVGDVHPELKTLLGRLKYRTSYGQNVLGHLVETAHIARAMATELGVDPAVVTRGAFLHDIGKALTHEAQGSHAIVGAELARRYGESEEVAHCIEAHHDEVAPATVEAVLTQAADSCSGGRPGARRESLESYVQRLERIESIAGAKKGVDKVFAMQAGRELRVMVKPDVVDDLEAHVLAREVAKQIEEELTYPGQVRVTVIRESRATEIAR